MTARSLAKLSDPRIAQCSALSVLLGIGVLHLDFAIAPIIAATICICALAAQRLSDWRHFDPLSVLITALSLCLLLRTNSVALAAAAAIIAIASKVLIRHHGKHIFNPSAFALVVITSLSDFAWIAPGQWGHAAFLLILVAAAGTIVSNRAARLDTSATFLCVYAIALFARAFYLGDPIAIPLHQLSSGALLIFAFFMISDPRTSPSARRGRMLFAAIVAIAGAAIEFGLYRANGPLYALVAVGPLVPLIDRIWPGTHYAWQTAPSQLVTVKPRNRLGVHHA